VPKCDLHHIVHLGRLPGLTPGVSKCHLPAKSPVSVTACSRGCDEYRPTVWRQRRPSPPSFTVSGARQYGHPGFPLFLRPPGARSEQRNPRTAGVSCFRRRQSLRSSVIVEIQQTATHGPHCTKNDGAPRGAVLLPFTARDQAPVLPIPACVPAPPLPMKVRER